MTEYEEHKEELDKLSEFIPQYCAETIEFGKIVQAYKNDGRDNEFDSALTDILEEADKSDIIDWVSRYISLEDIINEFSDGEVKEWINNHPDDILYRISNHNILDYLWTQI